MQNGRQVERMAAEPKEGDFWQADHIVPVAEGGGECDLNNYRTLWYEARLHTFGHTILPAMHHSPTKRRTFNSSP
eukprot:1181956-Prorocentrum_minimum.AAC.10